MGKQKARCPNKPKNNAFLQSFPAMPADEPLRHGEHPLRDFPLKVGRLLAVRVDAVCIYIYVDINKIYAFQLYILFFFIFPYIIPTKSTTSN